MVLMLKKTLLLLSVVCVANTMPAWATVPEEPAMDLQGAAEFLGDASPEVLEISEASVGPVFAGEAADFTRRRLTAVTSYIQNYNRKLESNEVNNISHAIVQFSDRYGVDYRLLTSLIAIESAFRRDAVSSSGAIGMGQLKPATAKWLGVANPYDPVDNIAGTARFLSWLMKKYNGNLEYTLSAYYQGPGYVDRNGVSPVCMPYLEKVNKALGSLL